MRTKLLKAKPLTGTQVQDAIIEVARKLGYLGLHVPDMRHVEPGWPDMVVAGRGMLLCLEAKSAGEQLRPASMTRKGRWLPGQADWLDAIGTAREIHAAVVRDRPEHEDELSYDQVLELLREGVGS